jgi:hypothetical protein
LDERVFLCMTMVCSFHQPPASDRRRHAVADLHECKLRGRGKHAAGRFVPRARTSLLHEPRGGSAPLRMMLLPRKAISVAQCRSPAACRRWCANTQRFVAERRFDA